MMISVTKKTFQLFNSQTIRSSLSSRECQQTTKNLTIIKLINHSIFRFYSKKDDDSKKEYFNTALTLHTFDVEESKSKETYLEVLRKYTSQPGRNIERVQFLYAALKYMDEFGVDKDLESYKKLLDVFPKGKMLPSNNIQAEFLHYPKEQKCAVYILDKMEDKGVIPDAEMEKMLLNTFGKESLPIHKYWRMMYWLPKFKNISPWPMPRPLPTDPLELAKLAIWKISSVDPQAEITVFKTDTVEDSIDKTWIVSAITPTQRKLLENHHPRTKAVYVEGPFPVYVRNVPVDYFVLWTKVPKSDIYKPPKIDVDDVKNLKTSYWDLKKTTIINYPSVHEQMHETIFSVCATGTSSKDSVLSWIRCLQKDNPVLSELHIVFTLKQSTKENVIYLEADTISKISEEEQKEIDER